MFCYNYCNFLIYTIKLQIWTIRFQLLLALKMYNALLEELQPFQDLDSPDTFLQYYAEYNLKGTMKEEYKSRTFFDFRFHYSIQFKNDSCGGAGLFLRTLVGV